MRYRIILRRTELIQVDVDAESWQEADQAAMDEYNTFGFDKAELLDYEMDVAESTLLNREEI